jgi:hypothetical protein
MCVRCYVIDLSSDPMWNLLAGGCCGSRVALYQLCAREEYGPWPLQFLSNCSMHRAKRSLCVTWIVMRDAWARESVKKVGAEMQENSDLNLC